VVSAPTTRRCFAAIAGRGGWRVSGAGSDDARPFLASFDLGRVRQVERALDQLFARVDALLERESVTLDLDADAGRASRAGNSHSTLALLADASSAGDRIGCNPAPFDAAAEDALQDAQAAVDGRRRSAGADKLRAVGIDCFAT
jgi:hypothetical protein